MLTAVPYLSAYEIAIANADMSVNGTEDSVFMAAPSASGADGDSARSLVKPFLADVWAKDFVNSEEDIGNMIKTILRRGTLC